MLVKKRILEVDLLRGIAVILMICFHFFFDLSYFYKINFTFWEEGFGKAIQLLGAGIFIFLVGVSFSLFQSRKKDSMSEKEIALKYFLDGLLIFLLGMILTLVTYLVDQELYIKFGVLHLIGISKMLLPLFIKFDRKKVYIILGILITSYFFSQIAPTTNVLSFLGLKNGAFTSLDYYPLTPWFSLVLLGDLIADFLYKKGEPILHIKQNKVNAFLILIGRKSLIIYFAHQPILLLLLYLFFKL